MGRVCDCCGRYNSCTTRNYCGACLDDEQGHFKPAFPDGKMGSGPILQKIEPRGSEWTSVENAMPEQDTYVLCYMDAWDEMQVDYWMEYQDSPVWAHQLIHDAGMVTHWMALPSSPM